MASIDVVLYTSKILKNGEHPVMIRLIKDRKPKYISTGESCSKTLWDDKKNLPSKKHPLSKEMIIKIEKVKIEAKRLLHKFEEEVTDFSSEQFTKKLKNQSRKTTVMQFLKEVIADLSKAQKIGNAEVYNSLRLAIRVFRKEKDFAFTELNGSFLRKFEQHFRERGIKETSMSVYFRTLRALYNRAVVEDYVKKEFDPFQEFKISKFNTKTKKRAIKKDEILKIANLTTDVGSRLFDSQNTFMFSYYCYGINICDIAELKWDNLSALGLIDYQRNKTNQQMMVQLLPPAKDILAYYRKFSVGKYIFPYLNEKKHITETQIKNRVKKITKQVNADLKIMAEMTGIDAHLTTYVARHSFATVLKRNGVDIAKISELLGHESQKTTKVYLDDFEDEELYEATLNLL